MARRKEAHPFIDDLHEMSEDRRLEEAGKRVEAINRTLAETFYVGSDLENLEQLKNELKAMLPPEQGNGVK